jgi:drug/metabolite transporter (DMT)-like permease
MIVGLLGAIFWAMETILLTAAMKHSTLTQMDVFSASLTAAACHDLLSGGYLLLYLGKKRKKIIPTIQSSGGRKIMLAALLGGPVGMSGYLLAIEHAGASLATSVSALYPAIGAFFSLLFLRERLRNDQVFGLLICVTGTVLLGIGSGGNEMTLLGFLFALLCAVSWGSEAVICSSGMKQNEISSEIAISLRQLTSGLTYLLVLVPVFHLGSCIKIMLHSMGFVFLLLAALCGTTSYLCYYRAIRCLGPSKAMAINVTYTVWVIVLEAVWMQRVPGLRSIICAVCISLGSVLTAQETKHFYKKGVKL